MTEEEFIQKLISDLRSSILYAKGQVKVDIPVDTGNLRDYAFRDKAIGVADVLNGYEHSLFFKQEGQHKKGVRDGIAPYTAAVNERPSRVQGWYDKKMVPHFAEYLNQALRAKGYVTELKEVKR